MGCCLTTTKSTSKPHGGGPPPPPPLPEEETVVKEVLSETPITTAIKPPPTKISGETQLTLHPGPLEELSRRNDVVQLTKNKTQEFRSSSNDVVPLTKNKIEELRSRNDVAGLTSKRIEEFRSSSNDVVPVTNKNKISEFRPPNDVVGLPIKNIEENAASEVSSDMYYYTYSESFSAATTTTTTTSFATDLKKGKIGNEEEEEGEVNQRVKIKKKKRPPEKLSPARKSPAPSTATSVRRGVGAPGRRSAVPSRNITTEKCCRNLVNSDGGLRRDPPVRRRSMSPAVRSPVTKSGSRVAVKTPENGENFKLKKISDGGVLPAPVPESETEICESLENPLVSLECFIFL